MSKTDDLAFPITYETYGAVLGEKTVVVKGGLTKREYFAALALQGILACPTISGITVEGAVKLADKLIEELNKEIK